MTGTTPPRQPTVHEVWQQRVWTVLPVEVAFEWSDLLGLYIRPGTALWRPVAADGTPLRLPDRAWTLRAEPWRTETLRLHLRDVPCSVGVQWAGPARRLQGWYLNIEDPISPAPGGYRTLDRIVDVVVARDRRSWRWKDLDEMRRAEELGIVGMVPPKSWLAEARAVLRMLRDWRGPFAVPWERWAPTCSA